MSNVLVFSLFFVLVFTPGFGVLCFNFNFLITVLVIIILKSILKTVCAVSLSLNVTMCYCMITQNEVFVFKDNNNLGNSKVPKSTKLSDQCARL